VSTSFGFGRNVVAPALSQLIAQYPALQLRLEVFDRIVDVAAEGFDLDVRVGDEIAPHLIAASGRQPPRAVRGPGLCAAAGSRARSTSCRHDCLVIKERDHPFGVWKLRSGSPRSVKVTGPLSTNHGEMAVQWARDGHGIVLRSLWDVAADLQAGACCRCCPVEQQANIWAVYPTRLERSAKVRAAWSSCRSFLAGGGGLQGQKRSCYRMMQHEFSCVAVIKKRKQRFFPDGSAQAGAICQRSLHGGGHQSHIGLAGQLGLDGAHDLAHVAGAGGTHSATMAATAAVISASPMRSGR
jgi:hypothetical protein